MTLRLVLSSEGHPQIWSEGSLLVSSLMVAWHPSSGFLPVSRSLSASPWTRTQNADSGFDNTLEQVWTAAGVRQLVAMVRCSDDVVSFSVRLEAPMEALATEDTFENGSLGWPCMTFPEAFRYLAITHGLGASGGEGAGGYWPEPVLADSLRGLPPRALTPLVLFDDHEALTIVPASQFLTSTLLADCSGVRRSLHGSVDMLPAGTCVETLLVWGRNVADSVLRAGDTLLAAGSKLRPSPRDHLMTSTLGWWNAYGGHYTEPIEPLDGEKLESLLESLDRQGIPIGYLGLDLWYPYEQIGQALEFSPDLEKYPQGLRPISDRWNLPMVLHLSALSPRNRYHADGTDPAFYSRVACELHAQGGVVAWHDWLRTQQHLTPELRHSPSTADGWFSGMARSMAAEGLHVLTCMQTMGMLLASTTLPNVISTRSSIDYLFGQPAALDTLELLGQGGFRNETTPAHRMRRQNLLVGFVGFAFGLLPFHDLFLTRHHAAVGGNAPEVEAVLRALSCGPVGIGDGPEGMADKDLLSALIDVHGRLLQPDHPPYPDASTLGDPVEIYRTEHRAGALRWEYLLALNTTNERQPYRLPIRSEETLLWDVRRRRVVPCSAGRLKGELEPGEIAYFLSAPRAAGMAPLGLWDKLVPAPADVLLDAALLEGERGWTLVLAAPGATLAVWSDDPIRVEDENRRVLDVQKEGSLHLCPLGSDVVTLDILRR
jgi:hypothetical protein